MMSVVETWFIFRGTDDEFYENMKQWYGHIFISRIVETSKVMVIPQKDLPRPKRVLIASVSIRRHFYTRDLEILKLATIEFWVKF